MLRAKQVQFKPKTKTATTMNHLLRCVFLSILALVILCVAKSATAQTKDTTKFVLEELSLEELLNIQTISVATKKSLTTRETPGIVTVISEDEIKNSGARELIDVLRLVPGFEFGLDVVGVVGLGIRGNWGHEGKILMLIDGQDFNENLYGTLQFGNNFPIEHIKKIEIVRGPGSAIYGGQAALAVMNVITKNADEISGMTVAGQYGQMQRTFGRRNLSVAFGKKFGDLNITAIGFIGQGNRSDRTYMDFAGNTFDMSNASFLDPIHFNFGLSYQNLDVRFIADRFSTTTQDGYGAITERPVPQNFSTYIADVKYDIAAGGKLIVTPRLTYRRQLPWDVVETFEGANPGNKITERITANVTALWDITKEINVLFGAECFNDAATVGSADPQENFFGVSRDQRSISYTNIAGFAQGVFALPIANLTIGARFDNQSAFGSAFVPRIGLTRVIDQLHIKFLASRAFRAPSFENIRSGIIISGNDTTSGIKPEFTTVFEAEVGYEITKTMSIALNVFDITIDQPIVYFSSTDDDVENPDGYRNFDRTGTRGLEVEYRLKERWGFVNLSYSFYSAAGKNLVASYTVPSNPDVLLGFATHKIALNSSFKVTEGLTISPSLTYLSERNGVNGNEVDSDGNPQVIKFQPLVLANVFLLYKSPIGLDIGAGVYDLFGSNYVFIQPYNNFSAPLPAPSREFVLKASYRFGLN
ncbi:MAG: hypothetical protein HY22_08815 [[Candidatus Thermochlorobacteriaceae] bacterium GBChlB]|nr:MAG: hypothetical protein HY22_08815 [[Candidatus Thermochlorobacteriaceae] bacterium GBChlB]